MKTQLPAGLVDSNVEIFDHEGKLKATYNGSVMDFFDLPEQIINDFLDLLIEDKAAWQEFKRQGMKDQGKMLEIYVRCNFGGWDRTPDYRNGKFNREFWACPMRGKCPFNEKICKKMKAPKGELSRREIDVIRLIANGRSAKQIGQILFISVKTVRTHMKTIHKKLDVHSNTGVAAFAFRNNITC